MKKKLLIIFFIILIIVLIIFPKTALADGKSDYIIVGDSRTIGMYNSYTGGTSGQPVDATKTVNGKNVKFLAVSGIGYDYWFGNSSHYSQITSALANAKNGSSCFIWLGINGNISDSYATKYANALETLAKKYSNVNIYFCSVTGIYNEQYDKWYATMDNTKIANFNNKVKNLIKNKSRSNLRYKDVANTTVKIGSESKTVNSYVVNSSKYAPDGLHYLPVLYKAIWEQAMTNNKIGDTNSSGGIIGESGHSTGSGARYSLSTSSGEEARGEVDFTDVLSNNDYYSDVGGIEENSKNKVENKIGKVIGVITNIGIVLSVLVLVCIGIKYIFSGKMDAKKDMVPYLIGTVMLFSVCIIAKVIMTMTE